MQNRIDSYKKRFYVYCVISLIYAFVVCLLRLPYTLAEIFDKNVDLAYMILIIPILFPIFMLSVFPDKHKTLTDKTNQN